MLVTPLVQARTMELVCTGGNNLSLVIHSNDGKVVPDIAGMDCPQCLLGAAAPPPEPVMQRAVFLPPYRFASMSVPHVMPLKTAPPPARGPPVSLTI